MRVGAFLVEIMSNAYFSFKQFTVYQDLCAMKVGTDATLLGAWAGVGERMLDIGTGTGVIALMMAQRLPESRVDAIDADADACRQASQNVMASPFSGRIDVIFRRLQDFAASHIEPIYDAVVSNPPYFNHALKSPDERRTMARHADSLPFRDLTACAFRLLKSEGTFSVVVPAEERGRMEMETLAAGFYPSRVCAVSTTATKPPRRYLLEFRKSASLVEQTVLVIGSDEHRRLMHPFLLDK